MELFLVSFLIFLLAILGMGLGILAGRPPIKGSCGGLYGVRGLGSGCVACDRPCPDRDRQESRNS